MGQSVIRATYHQVHLVPFDVIALYPSSPWDEKAVAVQGTDPASVIIQTGIANGPVTVNYAEGPPSDEHARLIEHGWETTQLTIPVDGTLLLCSPERDEGYEVFEPDAPGPHHVFVAAKGRDGHRDLTVFSPVEEYLILIWPAGS